MNIMAPFNQLTCSTLKRARGSRNNYGESLIFLKMEGKLYLFLLLHFLGIKTEL